MSPTRRSARRSRCEAARRLTGAVLGVLALAAPAAANDSIAELGTGGLVLSRTDMIEMASEDLYVSREEVRVDYVFRNRSGTAVEAIVAFPMPEIEANPYERPALPQETDDNMLGFEVTVDGTPVTPALEQRAFAVGLDVTADLARHGVPLQPYGAAVEAALAALPDRVAADWITRGIIVVDEYDAGQGWQRVRSPYWTLRQTYWWRTSFPAGRPLAVSHRYRPSVGATAGLSFFWNGTFGGSHAEYKARYCMDAAFERAVARIAGEGDGAYPALFEQRIRYVLTTGGNWANGVIGRFRLTVDKGSPGNLVSFCGENVRKTGPTTFEMEARDYYPERDLDVLILARPQADPTAVPAAPAVVRRKPQ